MEGVEMAETGAADYLTPVTQREHELTFENASKAYTLASRLDYSAFCINILSLIGTTFFGGRLHNTLRAGAVVFPKTDLAMTIVSIAFLALGISFQLLSNKLFNSLPEDKRIHFSYEKFKEHLAHWPSFNSHESLQEYIDKNPSFSHRSIMSLVNEINGPSDFLELRYDPLVDPYPHLYVRSHLLTKEEQKNLLLLACYKGIVLHFSHLEEYFYGKENTFNEYVNKSKSSLSNGQDLPIFRESLHLSLSFVTDVLNQYAMGQQFCPERINRQLAALAPKIFTGGVGFPFKPRIQISPDGLRLSIFSYFGENQLREITPLGTLPEKFEATYIYEGPFGRPGLVSRIPVVEFRLLDPLDFKLSSLTESTTPVANPLSYFQRVTLWLKA